MVKLRAPRLSADNKYILKKNGESHLGSMLITAISEETRRETEKYKWKAKVKPSSLALDMCFLEYQDTCDKYRKWTLVQKLSFLYGNAVHSFIGKYLVKNFPASYYKPTVPPKAMGWYEYSYPEIPIRSDTWLASAVIDYSARIRSAPVLIDWKTVHLPESEWIKFLENPWVSPNYIMQSASYCFLANEENYFPEKVKSFGICFINMFLEPADDQMWREVYFDYTPYEPVMRMLWELARESIEAKLAGKRVPCRNPYCKKCGTGKPGRLTSLADPWNPSTPKEINEVDFQLIRGNEMLDRASKMLEGLVDPETLLEEELWESYKLAEFY